MHTCSAEIEDMISGLHHSIHQRYKWIIRILKYASLKNDNVKSVIAGMEKERQAFSTWLLYELKKRPEHCSYIRDITLKHNSIYKLLHDLVYSISKNKAKNKSFDEVYNAMRAFTEAISDYHRHLEQLRSCYDTLTGLPMRKLFNERVIRETNKKRRNIYLLILDVDHFKNINDSYGHMIGDKVLIHIAKSLRKITRNDEMLCRFGGEEFIVILYADSNEDAYSAGKRLTKCIELETFLIDSIKIKITVTSGLTKLYPDEDITSALERADAGLYNGKRSGRNRCIFITRGEYQNIITK
ncbi:TPA: diguanylate cyclase [Klebsiella quasipneumoniae subsp. similipneumoniae]|nr:diguanylate cyclase [Klebsiella quasipneumoniae subsp. similipneumoniae]